MSGVRIDTAAIGEIAANLDLREPNREALESIAIELSQHYDVERKDRPMEAVIDVATGVGKTYIMASAIDYLATVRGVRNFAVITPGRTILRKTQDNFTPGHSKSLLDAMLVRPVVITSDNFASPAMGSAMDDPTQIKLFIFTVQALTKPQTSDVGKRTHKFQEGLGQAFYDHLLGLDDLIVFADEHHTYYGDAFSAAIRTLQPYALLGLTATPHKKTPLDQIIYRYPLAAAIASKLVKTPVIVGRQDDRTDTLTKLQDGVRLLDVKRAAVERYCVGSGQKPVNPVMLVTAQKIEDAEECRRLIEDPSFCGGAYQGRVLDITSDSPDSALEKLDRVEDPDSPIRVIVSVGMLKEGWDVKNVYVIASLRASISDILTEQTLGRGLRLPFGAYTGIEILDTLEVLAHERYEELLKKSQVLNESFIDQRTRAVLRTNAMGEQVATLETSRAATDVALVSPETPAAAAVGAVATAMAQGRPTVTTTEERIEEAEEGLKLEVRLAPRSGVSPLRVPRLVMRNVQAHFSLADITDVDPFRRLGERIAADPKGQLRRTTMGARLVQGPGGARRTELVTATAVDPIYSPVALVTLDNAVDELTARILAAPGVAARKTERAAAKPLIDAVLAGLGPKADDALSSYMDRVATEVIQLITSEQRQFLAKPTYEEVAEISVFAPLRIARPTASADRHGAFSKAMGYEGWRRSLYSQVWFDSSTERAAANMLDAAAPIDYWVRLLIGDLPILWNGAGNQYHPDFIAVETDTTHWIVEVKADNEMTDTDVQAKKQAAKRWANHVSADPQVGVRWRYLLVSESQIAMAKGSWAALKMHE